MRITLIITSFAMTICACSSDSEQLATTPSAAPNEAVVDGGLPPLEDAGSPLTDSGADVAPNPMPDRGPEPLRPPAPCGTAFPGEPMRTGLLEATPGYVEALTATDTTRVADPFVYTSESVLGRGLINYMLERDTTAPLSRADAQMDMGFAVLAAAAKGQGGKIDFQFARRGLHYFYPCTRPLPASLDVLRNRYGDYTQWPNNLIRCAKPKNGPRRIYENEEKGVYIAETVVGASVRETEVIFSKIRKDGQLDFAAYTQKGELSDRSTFATANGGTITSASPYTCMSCHIREGRFTERFPTGTGAGCR
jgi:hypothetical protein